VELGVGPESLVAIFQERSPELVVGILGILKAGGAYVPLSIEDPPDRLNFIVKEAGIAVILSQGGIESRWLDEGASNIQIVRIDHDHQDRANSPIKVPVIHDRPDQVAYVMYTSGSTGQPKGVAIRHRSIARLVCGNQLFNLDRGRTILQLAPAEFDASTFEIWGALLHGGRLVLAPNGPPDFAVLENLICTHKVDTLWLTTSLFNLVVDTSPGMLRSLDQIVVGGEALSVSHVSKAFHQMAPDARLINGYGPTESTTFATTYLIPRTLDPNVTSIPIGRPISNTRAFVLDENRQPVPIGVSGELCLGGDGLARGYLNRATLTEEKFISDPFTQDIDSRLYRTGDLCRWRADGNLEFLGRLDDQVKLRGHRIELGEIESVLNDHPEVTQSVVILSEDHLKDRRLIAYYVLVPGKEPNIQGIRTHLQSLLPDYMVPGVFLSLDSLPITTSGKINRCALPTPKDISDPVGASSDPKDLIELRWMEIWKKLFDRNSIRRQDNFFELGGHSLMAVRLAAEVEKILSRRLPIASLFQAPTIEALANMLRNENWTAPWASLVPLQPKGSKPPFFFVHGLGGDVYVFLNLARSLTPDQPIYGLQAEDQKGESGGEISIEKAASRYVEEIRSFQPEGPYYLGGYSLGGWIAYEIARQLSAQDQTVRMLAFFDTYPSCRLPVLTHLRIWLPRLARRLGFHSRQFFQKTRHEQVDYVKGRWTALRFILWTRLRQPMPGTQSPQNTNELQNPAPTTDAEAIDYETLCLRYRPGNYGGSVDLFHTEEMNQTWPKVLAKMVGGNVKIHRVPGNHHSMMLEAGHLPEIARIFGNALEDAQGKVSDAKEVPGTCAK